VQWLEVGVLFTIMMLIPVLFSAAMAAGLSWFLDPISMVGTWGYLDTENWRLIRNGMLKMFLVFLVPTLLTLRHDLEIGTVVAFFLCGIYSLMFYAMISSEVQRKRGGKGGWRYGWY